MAVLRNTLRDLLDAGKPTMGTHFLSHDPDIPEFIGDTGLFDYGEFVAEYATFDMPLLFHLARAAQCGNLPLMIKLDQANETFWAQMALGAGFKAVLFTDIRTPEDVERVHRAVRPDTPSQGGLMGVKLRRPALGGYELQGYAADLDSVVTVIMIEKKVAAENIDAILTVARERGIDMTQWGPTDFRFSYGPAAEMDADDVRAAEELVIRKSLEYGVAPRIEIGAVEQAQRYIDLGVRHFCIGWDRALMQAHFRALGEGLRPLIDGL